MVAQIAIKDIAGKDDKSAAFIDRKADQIVERLSGGVFNPLRKFGRFGGQAQERTIQMKVRRMKEFECRHGVFFAPANPLKP